MYSQQHAACNLKQYDTRRCATPGASYVPSPVLASLMEWILCLILPLTPLFYACINACSSREIFYTYEWISDVYHHSLDAVCCDRILYTSVSCPPPRQHAPCMWAIQLNLCLYRNINPTILHLFVLRVMAMGCRATHIHILTHIILVCTLCRCVVFNFVQLGAHFVCILWELCCVPATELRESSYNAKSITKT